MRALVATFGSLLLASCSMFDPYAAAGRAINQADGNTIYCWRKADRRQPQPGETEYLCYEPGYEPALASCQASLKAQDKPRPSVDAAKRELTECMAAAGWVRESADIIR